MIYFNMIYDMDKLENNKLDKLTNDSKNKSVTKEEIYKKIKKERKLRIKSIIFLKRIENLLEKSQSYPYENTRRYSL